MSEALHIENFEIISLLGQGGMSTVWKARQSSLDRLVAIKVLSASFATDPADIARFREEARAAGRLKHPGIVQVYDANFTNGSYYFVMELVDGYTVGEWIRRKGRLDENDALTVAESVIASLDYAWTDFGIIHCDIKPENIMVDADGSVKTTDLGLARAIVSMQASAQEQEVLGTPAYMSPEQVTGQPDLDCRADIYALGATIYHMVTGHPLFAGEGDDEIMQKQLVATVQSPSREAPGLSHGFVRLLAQMLAKDRKYRPQDWKAVMADLRRVRDHRTPAGSEPPPGSSTIFIDSNESDTVRLHTIQAAAANAAATGGSPDGSAWIGRLLLVILLLLAGGSAVWWFALGGSRQFKKQAAFSLATLSSDNRYQAALADVAGHPADLTGGIARLDAVLAQAPGSWYAQQARVQRDRLRLELETALQAIYEKLDAQAHDLVVHNHADEALQLLEKYQGDYVAETAVWRQEQAQMLRGQTPVPKPAPVPTPEPAPPPPPTTPEPAPPPHPRSTPRPAVMTEQEGLLRVARDLLNNGVDKANRRAADLAVSHADWDKNGGFGTLQKLLTQARATEQAVLDTFTAENGREISVALMQGTAKGMMGEVSEGRIHLIAAGGADKAYTLDDLDVGERLNRLKRADDSSAGATLLKAVWAYRAHATDRAKTLFASLPDPVGTTLVRVVDDKP
jgi:hypothetical protein